MIQKQKTDSVIDEIHETRREISERFHGDVFAIAEDAGRRQAASRRPVWKQDVQRAENETEQQSHE